MQGYHGNKLAFSTSSGHASHTNPCLTVVREGVAMILCCRCNTAFDSEFSLHWGLDIGPSSQPVTRGAAGQFEEGDAGGAGAEPGLSS